MQKKLFTELGLSPELPEAVAELEVVDLERLTPINHAGRVTP
jgi:hypothetical protein